MRMYNTDRRCYVRHGLELTGDRQVL